MTNGVLGHNMRGNNLKYILPLCTVKERIRLEVLCVSRCSSRSPRWCTSMLYSRRLLNIGCIISLQKAQCLLIFLNIIDSVRAVFGVTPSYQFLTFTVVVNFGASNSYCRIRCATRQYRLRGVLKAVD